MNKKIIYIPGWLDRKENFPQFENVLDVWNEYISPGIKLDCDVIVAYSLGCHFTLFNWEYIKDKKIIFVNPVAVKKSPFVWFWRWVKFRFHENQPENRRYIKNLFKILRGVFYFFKFLGKDIFSLLDNNNCDMVVIRGRSDIYFCDEESCQSLRNKNIKVVEIDDVGHLWHEKIDEEIKKIIGK